MILIADDDLQLRDVLALRLEQAGFSVVSVGDVAAAKESFDRETPDAAVVDVRMPGGDGFAVCEHIRNHGSSGAGIPVFLLTGADDGIVRNHLERLTQTVGGDFFLRKPYDAKALAVMLREAIGKEPRQGE